MSDYTLLIKIDPDHVQQFNSKGYKLCVASGVESGGAVNYNVVGHSSICAANVNVTWNDQYSIAATHDAFSGGKRFDIATTPQDIGFQYSYTLPKDWTDVPPKRDEDAPEAGFLFINHTPAASAVVYKKINGKFNPIYISAAGPLPPGREALLPKASVAVWFQVAYETGTMVSHFDTSKIVVDFTGKKSHTVQYDVNGEWTIL
ncbi:hypothetical protein F4810DRAFT_661944, partial [Camillea tinctor]